MKFSNVALILDTHLMTVAGLPTLQIENTRAVPVSGQPFARSTLAPAATAIATVGQSGLDQLNGLYQVDLMYPIDTAMYDARTGCDAICSAFISGLELTDGVVVVRIESSYPLTAYPYPQNGIIQLPVQVRWSCYIARS